MTSLTDKISQLVNEHCWETASRHSSGSYMASTQPIETVEMKKDDIGSLDFDLDHADFPDAYDCLLSDLPDFWSDNGLEFTSPAKRKQEDPLYPSLDPFGSLKRPKIEPPCVDFDTFCYEPQGGCDTPVWLGPAETSCDSDSLPKPAIREASVDSFASDNTCSGIETQYTAEYHFEQIRLHCQRATECLQRGRYEKTKNIVTWAHDIKNKFANEVKKAAEKAWEADKDKEDATSVRLAPRKPVIGSTKRVEQFRKNLRRWMTGTHAHQVGVEWMVYARMEHLQTIASFILGENLPSDPASPTAVAESISNFLGQPVSQEFVEQELAEPEPGKRYTIGPGLVPHLHAKQPRIVPSLAFTMPPESDPPAIQAWVAQLKALFPSKPAPKVKASKAKPCPPHILQ